MDVQRQKARVHAAVTSASLALVACIASCSESISSGGAVPDDPADAAVGSDGGPEVGSDGGAALAKVTFVKLPHSESALTIVNSVTPGPDGSALVMTQDQPSIAWYFSATNVSKWQLHRVLADGTVAWSVEVGPVSSDVSLYLPVVTLSDGRIVVGETNRLRILTASGTDDESVALSPPGSPLALGALSGGGLVGIMVEDNRERLGRIAWTGSGAPSYLQVPDLLDYGFGVVDDQGTVFWNDPGENPAGRISAVTATGVTTRTWENTLTGGRPAAGGGAFLVGVEGLVHVGPSGGELDRSEYNALRRRHPSLTELGLAILPDRQGLLATDMNPFPGKDVTDVLYLRVIGGELYSIQFSSNVAVGGAMANESGFWVVGDFQGRAAAAGIELRSGPKVSGVPFLLRVTSLDDLSDLGPGVEACRVRESACNTCFIECYMPLGCGETECLYAANWAADCLCRASERLAECIGSAELDATYSEKARSCYADSCANVCGITP